MYLYVITHTQSYGGWVFLTEDSAKTKLKELKEENEVIKSGFAITSYMVYDEELKSSIMATHPELLL